MGGLAYGTSDQCASLSLVDAGALQLTGFSFWCAEYAAGSIVTEVSCRITFIKDSLA